MKNKVLLSPAICRDGSIYYLSMSAQPHPAIIKPATAGPVLVLSFLVWCCISLVVAASILALRPPSAEPATAPPEQFSAERALGHVRVIARAPHPVGSPSQLLVRDYLLGQLSLLGLRPQVVSAMGVHTSGATVLAAPTQDIVGRLPGTASSGAILLMAHYDSVYRAPGAADDGAGVAAILETLRALRTGPALKNDVIVLFTDGEEAGLLGAEAFVASPQVKGIGAIINFEARGNQGLSMLFETSSNNHGVVDAFAKAAPYPVGSSLFYDLYQLLPNDTDFSVFRKLRIPGLNFAFGEGVEAYHSSLDVADRLSLASLQHHGSYAVALTRHLGQMQLDQLAHGAGDDVFFDWLGGNLIHYRRTWVLPLQAAATLLLLIGLALSIRKGEVRVVRLLAGLLPCLGFLALVPAALALVNVAITRVLGTRLALVDSGANSFLLIGYVMLGAGVASLIASISNRRFAVREFSLSSLVCLCILSWALTLLLPSGSYLLVWPLLLLTIGFLIVLWGNRTSSRVHAIAGVPGAVACVLLFAPLIYLLYVFLMLQLTTVVAVGVLLGVFFVALAPLLHVAVPASQNSRIVTILLLLLGAAGLGTGAGLSHPSANHPQSDTLVYSLDADDHAAAWITYDESVDAWTRSFFSNQPQPRRALPDHLAGSQRPVLSAVAPQISLLPPVAEIKADTKNGDLRKLQLNVRSQRNASTVFLTFPKENQVTGIKIGASDVALKPASGTVRINLFAVPDTGIDVQLTLKGANASFWLMDQSFDFPVPTPRRSDQFIAGSGSDVTVVCRKYKL